jgi:hypothetical protein
VREREEWVEREELGVSDGEGRRGEGSRREGYVV